MNEQPSVELGLGTFGDVSVGADGLPLPYAQVIRNIVAEAVLADRLGVQHFGVGEHHRDDYAVSAPEVVLAAIAARTQQIKLGTAVTVLSSDDPVRVFERFATLDAVSDGRAEITAGRGSFTESFPLFGYDLADYSRLFEEKLDLLVRLRTEGPVTWSGTTRAGLSDQQVYPKTTSGRLPLWVGVGGSPESVVRAARYGLPLMLGVIGGSPARFLPYVDLYHRATAEFGFGDLPVGVHSGGFVADTDVEAQEVLYPYYKATMDHIGAERGWPSLTRSQYLQEITHGSLYVGSPATVAAKIAETVTTLGVQRFDLKYGHGPTPHPALLRSVELFGTEVMPRVREILGARTDREEQAV